MTPGFGQVREHTPSSSTNPSQSLSTPSHTSPCPGKTSGFASLQSPSQSVTPSKSASRQAAAGKRTNPPTAGLSRPPTENVAPRNRHSFAGGAGSVIDTCPLGSGAAANVQALVCRLTLAPDSGQGPVLE